MSVEKAVSRFARWVPATALAATSMASVALPLVEREGSSLNLDVEVAAAAFSSSETYGNAESEPSWTEGYAKYGLSGFNHVAGAELYFGANALTSLTAGDGDASGVTTGDERRTALEDLYLGVRRDGLDLSVGRQNFKVGDGFLINGDALNMGEGLDGIAPDFSADRGGAYWLAARKAFDRTLVLRVGNETGLRADAFWLHSDNPAQASTELAGVNLEYTNAQGTFGAMLVQGLGVDRIEADFMGLQRRDGQLTASLRFQGNAGIDPLFLSAEVVDQSQGNDEKDANAWYLEAGWTFADAPLTPSLNYRYTHYDEGFDSLFFGFSRGYGTWFQGEVAANYAGPFGTDANIQYLGATAHVSEMLTIGGSLFDFSNTVGGTGSNDAREFDLWAEWVAAEHLIISPLLGFYTPQSDSSKQGNTGTNRYMQVMAVVPF
jgi:hypothetical protein